MTVHVETRALNIRSRTNSPEHVRKLPRDSLVLLVPGFTTKYPVTRANSARNAQRETERERKITAGDIFGQNFSFWRAERTAKTCSISTYA